MTFLLQQYTRKVLKMKEKFECSLTLMVQKNFEIEADADEPEFDDAIESGRDKIIAKLEEAGFAVSVLSEEVL